jgi:hypothetical protein
VIIRWATLQRHSGFGYDAGAGYGIYLALIAGLIEVAVAAAEVRTSGEPLPWSGPGRRRAVG